MPPLSDTVVTTEGAVIIPNGDIGRGQNVWQALGGMEVGSVWGHGSYVAPDWTADWLHREAAFILNDWAQKEFATGYDRLSPEDQGKLRGRLEAMYRRNTYDPSTHSIIIEPVRARAFEANLVHYSDVFINGNKAYAIPSGSVSTPERMRQFSAFIFWTAWSASATRPVETVSYAQNWPFEPIGGNRPTGDSVLWTGVSIIMLLAGICAMVWWYASETEEEALLKLPVTDPLGNWKATPSQRATLKYFWIVSALIPVPILMGVVTAHYGVEGVRHQALTNSAVQRHAHLARPARYLLDCHRVACRRTIHRSTRQQVRAKIPGARRSCSLRRPARHRRRLHGRRIHEHPQQTLSGGLLPLGPSGL